ncbi:MAG: hypothetical protein LQ348_005076 [Seirophora lacunosa]|nr:MAG: hypothetical protein LQ348_005076 [Seirophora lacunosa]
MDQLPPEMLDRIAQQLSNDKHALKCLRLSTQRLSAAAIKYLYQDLVLYNTTCSWENFSLVISHPIYSRFVKSIESSNPRCDCLDCIDSSGNLDRRVTLCDTSSGVTALKLTGFCHPFSQVLAQINDCSNTRKLELDFSFRVLYCFNMEIIPFFEHTLKPIWFPKLKDTVRDLSITQRLPGTIPVRLLDWLIPSMEWSGLEKLSLSHILLSPRPLERLIRQHSKTLTSLRIIEPFIHPQQWSSLRRRLREVAPKLKHLECPEPCTMPVHP